MEGTALNDGGGTDLAQPAISLCCPKPDCIEHPRSQSALMYCSLRYAALLVSVPLKNSTVKHVRYFTRTQSIRDMR